jgi:hypothetical protein
MTVHVQVRRSSRARPAPFVFHGLDLEGRHTHGRAWRGRRLALCLEGWGATALELKDLAMPLRVEQGAAVGDAAADEHKGLLQVCCHASHASKKGSIVEERDCMHAAHVGM